VNTIISAFDIVAALVDCDDVFARLGVKAAYENELTQAVALIVVKDTLVINGRARFNVEVRGSPGNGQSTADIAQELIKYHTYYQMLEIKNNSYNIRFLFDFTESKEPDELGRTMIALNVYVKVIEN